MATIVWMDERCGKGEGRKEGEGRKWWQREEGGRGRERKGEREGREM